MGKYLVEESSLTSIADALRAKTATNNDISFPQGFIDLINTPGNGELKFATGTLKFNSDYSVSASSGGGQEVAHNLGVIPDIIFIRATNTISDVIHLAYYFGARANGVFGKGTSFQVTGKSGSNNISVLEENHSTDFTSTSSRPVRSATATTFNFAPSSSMSAKSGETYIWYALGRN